MNSFVTISARRLFWFRVCCMCVCVRLCALNKCFYSCSRWFSSLVFIDHSISLLKVVIIRKQQQQQKPGGCWTYINWKFIEKWLFIFFSLNLFTIECVLNFNSREIEEEQKKKIYIESFELKSILFSLNSIYRLHTQFNRQNRWHVGVPNSSSQSLTSYQFRINIFFALPADRKVNTNVLNVVDYVRNTFWFGRDDSRFIYKCN